MRSTWIRIGRWSLLAAVGGIVVVGAARAHTRRRAKNEAQDSGLFAGSTTPQLVAKQFKFTEGPAVDKAGNVYFTDQPNNKIWKYDLHGQLSVYMDPAGRANGMYFDRQGNLIVCADEQNQLWSISPDKKVTVLVDQPPGHRLNGPNDVWVARMGVFTSPTPTTSATTGRAPRPSSPASMCITSPPGSTSPR